MYIYVHVCMCTCVHIRICMHNHTHTHTYAHIQGHWQRRIGVYNIVVHLIILFLLGIASLDSWNFMYNNNFSLKMPTINYKNSTLQHTATHCNTLPIWTIQPGLLHFVLKSIQMRECVICAYKNMHTYIHIYMYKCTYLCIWIHVYTYICMYIHICTPLHNAFSLVTPTHTHTASRKEESRHLHT